MTANPIITASKKTSTGWVFTLSPTSNSSATPYTYLSSTFQPLIRGSEIAFVSNTNIPRFYTSNNTVFYTAFHAYLEQALKQAKVSPVYLTQFLNAVYPLKATYNEIQRDIEAHLTSSATAPLSTAIKATKKAFLEAIEVLLTSYKTQNTYAAVLEILLPNFADSPLTTTAANQLKALAKRIEDLDKFKEDPYQYAQATLSLETIDQFAKALSLTKQSRAMGTVSHILKQRYESDGHTCYPHIRLIKEAAHQTTHSDLKGQKHYFSDIISNQSSFIQVEAGDETYVYLSKVYALEESVATKLAALANQNTDPQPPKLITNLIKTYEDSHHTTLSEQQKDAINRIFTSTDTVVITGYPGTGKSTITDCIRFIHQIIHPEELSPERNMTLFAAPTGIAANRLNKGKGMTLHRALQVMVTASNGKFTFLRNSTNPFPNRLVIIDEFSMVDLELAYHLLDAIIAGQTKLVIIGDHNQLPSVGPGDVLRHIIASQAIQTVKLTKIFRQQSTNTLNPIIALAKIINKGREMPSLEQLNNEHIKFINQSKDHEIYKIILKLFKKHKQNCQILFPTKREASVGSINGNNIIANELHDSSIVKGKFAINDKIICTKNCAVIDDNGQVDTAASIFNGEIGRALNIESLTNTILFESSTKRLQVHMDNLEHGWCITVNKSQGSEYDTVILVLHASQGIMLNRQVLYTAVTRAKKLLYIVATPDTLHQAITTPAPARHSLLSSLLAGI